MRCLQYFGLVLSSFLIVTFASATAHADLVVHINRSSQSMTVTRDGQPLYHWVVSTGRAGYGTPSGVFHPQRLARTWFSRAYYNSPMPYSIFFYGGYAIHGTYAIRQLGGPASHGCVRLYPGNAATLFALVQREGMGRTTIVVN
jgi:lipoprotein-anchoring transpeptidase ErfK/SrfK